MMIDEGDLCVPINALTAVGALMTLIDFTLSNARRFYSSMGNPSEVKGLIPVLALTLTNRNISTIGAYQKTASINVLYSNCLLLNIELKI